MKNFRKVLALILVVATLFSFVAMASAKSAEDYKDYADVKYTEAVDVLTAIGITEGYDGAYHPADPIGRDEVAAMIARLRNGGDIDAKLYVGADKVFADVKGQWSEGYVTYCSQLGIVAGRNATTFDPTGKVTGTEVLKMLLCVLGYDAKEQGYVGSNWQVNVVRDAKKTGLLIDGVDVYAAATRDEVAQYFLNALKSRMVVGYLGNGVIDITNSIWVDLTGERKFPLDIIDTVTPDSVVSTKLGQFEVTYGNAVISGTFLYESIKGLEITSNTSDCYGRPGYTWTYTVANKVLFSGLYTYAPTYTYTEGADNLSTDLKNYDFKDINLYDNGVEKNYTSLNAYAKACGGRGSLVEVFVLADNNVVVTSKMTYIGKVSKVNNVNDTFTLVQADGTTEIGTFAQTDVELAEGDMVLFYICAGRTDCGSTNAATDGELASWIAYVLHDIEVVEPVVATITSGKNYFYTGDDGKTAGGMNYNKGYFVADGKTYYYNMNFGRLMNDDVANALQYKDATKSYIYTDAYGNAMYVTKWANTTYHYAYVEEGSLTAKDQTYSMDAAGTSESSWTYRASLVSYADATPTETVVSKDLWDGMELWGRVMDTADPNFVSLDAPGKLIRYQTGDNGNMINLDMESYICDEGAKVGGGSHIIGSGEVYADNDTVFMIRYTDGLGKYSYKTVTGYKNVTDTYYAQQVTAHVGDTTPMMLTNIQYFTKGDSLVATYVFIDARYSNGADHFYLMGLSPWNGYDSSAYAGDYDCYRAIVDGVDSYVLVDHNLGMGTLTPGMYEDTMIYQGVSVEDGQKLYFLAERTAPSTALNGSTVNIDSTNEGMVYVATGKETGEYYIAASDLKIFYIQQPTAANGYNGYKMLKLSDLPNANTGNAWVYFNADGQVSEIYLLAAQG